METIVYTVGHSTHPLEEFIVILRSYGVRLLADIRTIPRSRHNPQFNGDSLPRDLESHGIRYLHLKGLGGLRRPLRDSPNTGWRNPSFRGYADFMQTEVFASELDGLVFLAGGTVTAIMCAEALPWRCHRSLVADALVVRGIRVIHIMSAHASSDHAMTRMAKIQGSHVVYPGTGELKENERSA